MRRTFLLLAVLTLSACATVGPPRPTLAQALSGEEAPPPPVEPKESAAYACITPDGAPAPTVSAMSAEPIPTPLTDVAEPASENLPSASPFSAGLLLGAGLYLDGSGVLPAQLAVGSVKVVSLGRRAINLLALGGISATSVSEARGAWGAGASVELTPGTLPYEVDAALGVLWVSGGSSPAALLGFTLTPKM